jgi:ribosomal protein S18 acetylase RimI-like enzyme
MDVITTRTATIADLDILLNFEQGVIQSERPFDPTLKGGPINYYDIAAMIQSPHIEVVVAESGSEIIGSGYARIEDSKVYLKHPKHAYLGFMYVKPEYRGKGVNKKVINALQQWAVARGITEFRLDVYHDNLPAIAAYEKVGFSKHMIEMRMGVKAEKP